MINGVFGVNTMSGISGVSSYGRYGSYGAYSAYGFYGSTRTAETSRIVRTQPVQRTGAVPVVRRASNIGTPVEPVRPIKAVMANVTDGVSYAIPFLRKGMDPAELAVRMRIQYEDGTQAKTAMGKESASDTAVKAEVDLNASQGAESVQRTAEEGECKTCEQRKYQDGSNDAGVSYKSPTHIAPEQASAAVRGHEMEHVVRERAKAAREGREVVSQSVTMHTAVCPECGKVYVSGGTTRTTTAESQEMPVPDNQE